MIAITAKTIIRALKQNTHSINPKTMATGTRMIRIPSQIKKCPLQQKAQIVSRRVMPTVAPIARGITGPSTFYTTIEQTKLITYEKHSTKARSISKSQGDCLDLGTQHTTITMAMMSRIGKMTTHQLLVWKFLQASTY